MNNMSNSTSDNEANINDFKQENNIINLYRKSISQDIPVSYNTIF